MRIVLDTNILIAVIGRRSPFRWLFDKIIAGEIQLCVTTEILLEYREILEQKNGYDVAENVVNFITVMPTTERVKSSTHSGSSRKTKMMTSLQTAQLPPMRSIWYRMTAILAS